MAKITAEEFASEFKALAERLTHCDRILRQHGAGGEEAWVLAHSLLDLAESFRTFLEEQLPRVRDERLNCDELYDVLIEIGDEFRHIIYHIREPEFYAYLREDGSRRSDEEESH